jgi:hypothetical protein
MAGFAIDSGLIDSCRGEALQDLASSIMHSRKHVNSTPTTIEREFYLRFFRPMPATLEMISRQN